MDKIKTRRNFFMRNIYPQLLLDFKLEEKRIAHCGDRRIMPESNSSTWLCNGYRINGRCRFTIRNWLYPGFPVCLVTAKKPNKNKGASKLK
jgi:hypothetical protein